MTLLPLTARTRRGRRVTRWFLALTWQRPSVRLCGAAGKVARWLAWAERMVGMSRLGAEMTGLACILEEQRDEARAEVARLQGQLTGICDTIRYHLPAEVPEGSDVGALVVAAANLHTERDIQTGRVMIENARLRAALAVFADRGNWANDILDADGTECFVWIGDVHKPWLLAQAALEDSPAASANVAGPGPTGQIDSDHDHLCTVAAVNPPGISELSGGCQIPAPPPSAQVGHCGASSLGDNL